MFGTGHVGLVTGACFAEMGHSVLCVDIDADKVASLRAGRVPMFEPDLERMVNSNTRDGRLRFTTDAQLGVGHGEVLFIAVGTPADAAGAADLRHVLAVAEDIGRFLEAPKIIVNESTVPVGTADQVREKISEVLAARNADIDFDVASNPEFQREGTAIGDFMQPDRIIVGCERMDTRKVLERLFAPLDRNRDKILYMDVRSAELTKYAANVMLATRISLMNELAGLAERLGADIEAVRRGVGGDPRIGRHHLRAGTGYGGSCLPKDVKAVVRAGASVGFETRIAQGVETVNERQKSVLIEKMLAHYDGGLGGRTFALWGLSFKPNTDDMREAPSRAVIDRLLASNARVRAYDPVAGQEAVRLYGDAIEVCERRDDTLLGADGLIIVTEWNEFRSPDFHALRAALKEPAVFDGRNLYDPAHLAELGFAYYCIGRTSVAARDPAAGSESRRAPADGGIETTQPGLGRAASSKGNSGPG